MVRGEMLTFARRVPTRFLAPLLEELVRRHGAVVVLEALALAIHATRRDAA